MHTHLQSIDVGGCKLFFTAKSQKLLSAAYHLCIKISGLHYICSHKTFFFAPIRQLPVVPDADPGFGQRGPQILRLKVGERSALSVAGSFWIFNTQICVLPHSRDSFSLNLHLLQHQKLIKKNIRLYFNHLEIFLCTTPIFWSSWKSYALIEWLEEVCQVKWDKKILWHAWWKIDCVTGR